MRIIMKAPISKFEGVRSVRKKEVELEKKVYIDDLRRPFFEPN